MNWPKIRRSTVPRRRCRSMPMRVMPLLSGLDVSRPSARDDYTPAVHAATITLREATTTDVPTLLALVHAAFEQYRDCLDPPSGAHRETEASLRAALHAGGAPRAGDGHAARTARRAHRVAAAPRLLRALWLSGRARGAPRGLRSADLCGY